MGMPEDTTPHPYDRSASIQDLVSLGRYIRRYKWLFLLCCAAVFTITFFLHHWNTRYVSKITFTSNSSNVAEILWDRSADIPLEMYNQDKAYNRISQIINSSQMQEYLIENFNLYAHYGIPPKAKDSHLNIVATLKSMITVTMAKNDIITVQVKDPLDYNVAANMANAIGKKINDVNRQIIIDNLTRKREMFLALSKDLRSSTTREYNEMDSLLRSMQAILGTTGSGDGYKQVFNMTLQNIIDNSDDYFTSLFESYKYRLFSTYTLEEKYLPTITILEPAVPDAKSKYEKNIYMYPLILMFSIIVPLFLSYFLMKASPVLAYILRESARDKY